MQLNKIKQTGVWIFSALVFFSFSGCGFKGDLYIAPSVEQTQTNIEVRDANSAQTEQTNQTEQTKEMKQTESTKSDEVEQSTKNQPVKEPKSAGAQN